eukprot:gene10633-3256_t
MSENGFKEERIEFIKDEMASKIAEAKEEVINLSEGETMETIEKMKKKLEKNREEQKEKDMHLKLETKNSKKNLPSSPTTSKRTENEKSKKKSPMTPRGSKSRLKSPRSLVSPALESDEVSDLGLSLDQETALTMELETVNLQKQYEQTIKERLEHSRTNYISVLPTDIFAEILTYLPQPETLYTVNQVSKQFYNYSNNDLLWKKSYQKYYYNQEIDPRLIKYIPEFKSPCLRNYRKNLILLKKKKDKYLKRSKTKIEQFLLPFFVTVSLILFTILCGIYIDGYLTQDYWWIKLLIYLPMISILTFYFSSIIFYLLYETLCCKYGFKDLNHVKIFLRNILSSLFFQVGIFFVGLKWIGLPTRVYWVYMSIPSEVLFLIYYFPMICGIIFNAVKKFLKEQKIRGFKFKENQRELDDIGPPSQNQIRKNSNSTYKPASNTIITELDDESTLGSISNGDIQQKRKFSSLNPFATIFILGNLVVLFICVALSIMVIPAKMDNLIPFNWVWVFIPLWIIFFILIISPSGFIIFEILLDKQEDKSNILLGFIPIGIFLPGLISLILIVISLDELIPGFPVTIGCVGLAFMESMLGCIVILISFANYLSTVRKYQRRKSIELDE